MQKFTNLKGKKLEYRVTGSGPAVVLVHGFGEDNTIWNKLISNLPGYQFIIPNLPGTGASEMLDNMSMEGLAEALKAVLEKEGIEKCVMIGHSMGGYITLAFVDQYASMLSGFGLFHSSAFADNDEKKATRHKGINFMKENGAFPFLKTVVPNLYSPATKEEKPTLIEEHLALVQPFAAQASIHYYEAMINRPDRTHLLKETPLPVFFILGKWDTAVPFEDGLKQCHFPQLSYIEVLNQSAHMGMVEEVDKAAAAVKKFLSDTLPYTTT